MQIQISIPFHFLKNMNIVRIKLSRLCKFKLQRYLASQRQRKWCFPCSCDFTSFPGYHSLFWFHFESLPWPEYFFGQKKPNIPVKLKPMNQWYPVRRDKRNGSVSSVSHWQLSTMSICLCQISAMKRIVMDGYYSRCTKKSKPLNCPCAPWPWPIALVDHNIAHVRILSLIHTTQAMSNDRSHSVFPTCKCVW